MASGSAPFVLSSPPLPYYPHVVSAVAAFVLLAGGAFYFRRMEKTFADLV